MKLGIGSPGQLAIALGMFAMPSVSYAAEGLEPAADDRNTNEIIVTARKRSETLQDTPVPVTVLSQEKIDALAIESLDDIATAVPGLIIGGHSGNSGGSIFLRGVGSGETNPLIEQAVATNIDGVVAGTGQIRKAAMMDVARVEVLRGPQALFFGKNSPGGVVSIITADPGDKLEAKARFSYETEASETVFEGIISGPVTDSFGLRLAASKLHSEGYFDVQKFDLAIPGFEPYNTRKFPGSDETFARVTALWQGPRTSAKAKLTLFDASVDAGPAASAQRIDCPTGSPQRQPVVFDCVADRITQNAGVARSVIALDPTATNFSPEGFQENTQVLATLELKHEISDTINLTSITGYYHAKDELGGSYALGPVNTFNVSRNSFRMRQLNQEFRLDTHLGGSWDFMLDGYYEERNSRAGISLTAFNTVYRGREEVGQSQEAYSLAGQVVWRPIKLLELAAGGRYSHEEKTIDVSFNGTPVTLAKNSDSWNDFSPEITAAFRPTDTLNIYASYKQGFKSGGFDASFGARARNGRSYDQENIEGFEVGVKAQLFGRSLILDAVAYAYNYTGLQVAVFDSQTLSFQLLNAADARIRGLELSALWITPIDGLRINAGFAYNDAKYGEFITSCYSGQTVVGGCNLALNTATGAYRAQNVEGEPLVFAPKTVMNLGVDYKVDLNSNWHLNLLGNWRYTSAYSARAGGRQPSATQAAVSKFDASISVSNDWATLAIKGRNLTNKYTYLRLVDVPLTGSGTGTPNGIPGDQAAHLSRGRELMFAATFRY